MNVNSPMAPRWNEETTLKFVLLYRESECLWNTRIPSYSDKIKRYEAMKRISDRMLLPDFGASDVPKKIKILRSTYYQELIKIQRSKQNVDDYVYVPALRWFNIMDEILRDLPSRRRPSRLETEPETCAEDSLLTSSGNEEEMLNTLVDPLSCRMEVKVKKELIGEDGVELNNDPGSDDANHTEKHPTSRSANRSKQDYRRILRRLPLRRRRQILRLRRKRGEDEYDIFGRHVAAQMRLLDEAEYVATQEQIQSALSQARLRTIHSHSLASTNSQVQEDKVFPRWSP